MFSEANPSNSSAEIALAFAFANVFYFFGDKLALIKQKVSSSWMGQMSRWCRKAQKTFTHDFSYFVKINI